MLVRHRIESQNNLYKNEVIIKKCNCYQIIGNLLYYDFFITKLHIYEEDRKEEENYIG